MGFALIGADQGYLPEAPVKEQEIRGSVDMFGKAILKNNNQLVSIRSFMGNALLVEPTFKFEYTWRNISNQTPLVFVNGYKSRQTAALES